MRRRNIFEMTIKILEIVDEINQKLDKILKERTESGLPEAVTNTILKRGKYGRE